MRILNVAQTYFPYVAEGGRPAKVRAISRKLVEHGHSVTVLTANLGISEWSNVAYPRGTAMGLQLTEYGVVAIYLPTVARYRVLTINPRVIRFCRAVSPSLTWFIFMVSTICSDQWLVIFAGGKEFLT